jgi:tRNA1Val (adenine37-N6)-methyltransferase
METSGLVAVAGKLNTDAMFTYQYTQPDEYHFSLDSIHLAEFIAQELQQHQNLQSLRVLDLCSGCGVIGLELSWYVRELRQIDFIEVQDIYTQYFFQNIDLVNRPELQLRWHCLNYDALLEKEWAEKFDLIVSNPPYFQSEHGTLSPSMFKNRCRFYLDSSFRNFLLAIENSLAIGGKAYFLQRPLTQHGYDVFCEIKAILQHSTADVRKLSQIRGTDVYLMEKLYF